MAIKETISAPRERNDEQYGPLLDIPRSNGKPFSFGPDKAHAIVRNLEAIKAFAAKNPLKQAVKVDASAVASMTPEEKAQLIALLKAA